MPTTRERLKPRPLLPRNTHSLRHGAWTHALSIHEGLRLFPWPHEIRNELPGGRTSYDTKYGFVFSVGSVTFGGSLVLDPILQRIIRNVLNECLAGRSPTLDVSQYVDRDVIHWIIEGILGVGPHGPVPAPPHGPARDILISLIAGEVANRMSSPEERLEMRRTSMEMIARIAKAAARKEEK